MSETLIANTARAQAPASPFVGLEPYGEADAAFFFGRADERRIIAANLDSSRLTLLYGASGVGKSSVLRAGVLHHLRKRIRSDASERLDDEPVPLAAVYFADWREPDPVRALMQRLHTAVEEALGTDAGFDPAADVLDTLRAWNAEVGSIVVILDQFEEFFLYHPYESGPGTWNDEFPRIVNDPTLRVNFLISIREDAWAKLDHFKPTIPALFSNYLRLRYLERGAAAEAITAPVAKYNEVLASDPPYEVDADLVAAVLDGAETRTPGLSPDDATEAGTPQTHIESPFLQLVMERLWEATVHAGRHKLSVATLNDELGGAQEIVRNHVERALSDVEGEDREIVASALRFLITSSKTKMAQRVSDLAVWTDTPEAEMQAVLEQLARTGSGRVLRPLPPAPGETSPRFEIFHDVLCEPLLAWRRLIQAEQEKVERLEEERQRHETQVNRIVRLSLVALALLTAALVVAVIAVIRERSVAESRALAASATAQLDTDPELSVLLAREALDKHETREAVQGLREALSMSHLRHRLVPTSGDVNLIAGPNQTMMTLSSASAQRWGGQTPPQELGEPLTLHDDIQFGEFSDDGTGMVVAGADGARADVGGRLSPYLTTGQVLGLAISADARYVAVADEEYVRIFRTRTGEELRRMSHASGTLDLSFDPFDTARLAVASCDENSIGVWNWRTDRMRKLISPDKYGNTATCAVSFSPYGTHLLSAINGAAVLWNAKSAKPIREHLPPLEEGDPDDLIAWSPDGALLALATRSANANVYDTVDGSLTTTTDRPGDILTSVAFNLTGTMLATGAQDGQLMVSDARTGVTVIRLRGHAQEISTVRFLGTSSLVTASRDRTLKVWDLSTGRTIGEPQSNIVSVDLSPDDRRLVVTDGSSSSIVTVPGGAYRPLVTYESLPTINAVAFVDSGARVIEGGVDLNGVGAVMIADPEKGSEMQLDLGKPDLPEVRGVDLSPRSNLLVVSLTGANAVVFDLADRKHPRRIGELASGESASARFDRSGERIVTAGDRLAQVFDARTRKRISSFTHPGWVNGAVFSPDGSRVLSYGIDRTTHIWDPRSGREVVPPQGHSSWVLTGEFSPDGTVVTGSQDGVVRVWDATTGYMIGLERPQVGAVMAAGFSSNGHGYFTAGWDGALKLGACESCGSVTHLRELAHKRLTRGFSAAERTEFSIG